MWCRRQVNDGVNLLRGAGPLCNSAKQFAERDPHAVFIIDAELAANLDLQLLSRLREACSDAVCLRAFDTRGIRMGVSAFRLLLVGSARTARQVDRLQDIIDHLMSVKPQGTDMITWCARWNNWLEEYEFEAGAPWQPSLKMLLEKLNS